MTELRIRNVDPWVVESIRRIAKQNNRSMENEIKEALFTIANDDKRKILAKLRRLREKQLAEFGMMSDSTPDIRAERDAL